VVICLCISAVEGSFPEGAGEVGGAVVDISPIGSFFATASWRCPDRVENPRVDLSASLRTIEDCCGCVREIEKSDRRMLFGRAARLNARMHCVQVYEELIVFGGAS
jgi:hypothetical protein